MNETRLKKEILTIEEKYNVEDSKLKIEYISTNSALLYYNSQANLTFFFRVLPSSTNINSYLYFTRLSYVRCMCLANENLHVDQWRCIFILTWKIIFEKKETNQSERLDQNISHEMIVYLSIKNPCLKSLSYGIDARRSSVWKRRRNASRAAISSAMEIVVPAPIKIIEYFSYFTAKFFYFFQGILYSNKRQ